jgi:hypothetical protein
MEVGKQEVGQEDYLEREKTMEEGTKEVREEEKTKDGRLEKKSSDKNKK